MSRRLVVRSLLAVTVAVLAFATFAVLARTVIHGPVTGRSLAKSVALETGSASTLLDDDEACERTRRARVWRCSLYDASGSGGVGYRVRLQKGGSCWRGRLVASQGEGGTDPRARGCVKLWQWTVFDLL